MDPDPEPDLEPDDNYDDGDDGGGGDDGGDDGGDPEIANPQIGALLANANVDLQGAIAALGGKINILPEKRIELPPWAEAVPPVPVMKRSINMVDQIEPKVVDVKEAARAAEREILKNRLRELTTYGEDDRTIVANAIVALGELGRMPPDQLPGTLAIVLAQGAYMGRIDITEKPRMRNFQNEYVWSRATLESNQAEFFTIPAGEKSPYQYRLCNIPESNRLGRDVRFIAKAFHVLPLNPADYERFTDLTEDYEVSEYIDGVEVGSPWKIHRVTKKEFIAAGRSPFPEPERKKAAALGSEVMRELSKAPRFRIPVKQAELLNRKVHWKIRTVGTNAGDGMVLYGVLEGALTWDERKDIKV